MLNLKTFLIVPIFLLYNTCIAQFNNKDSYKDFSRSFTTLIDYPDQLVNSCTPQICLLMIQTDSAKNIIDMKLSDSANELLVTEFLNNKSKMDTKSLTGYLKNEFAYTTCTTFLIPISYRVFQTPCPQVVIKPDILLGYLKFNGVYVKGNVLFLSPIETVTHIQR